MRMDTHGGLIKSCLELAREGEKLCRERRFEEGIRYLTQALEIGSEDVRVVSAIHSQLGNAYFALGRLQEAHDHHCHDVTAATIIMQTNGDRVGIAKALGNLSNTLKEMGRFEDAVKVANQHLKIGQELKNKQIQARAKYTLGSIYLARAKRCPESAKETYKNDLEEARDLFKDCLTLLEDLNDPAGCGRLYGNLGNTHYLLGEFRKAIEYHELRQESARQFGDKDGERRAFTNLGNAYLLLSDAEKAFEYFQLAYNLAKSKDPKETPDTIIVVAQLAFSLGNTAVILSDFNKAIEFHLQHLFLAREVKDRAGEVRAHIALAEDHRKKGDLPKALYFLSKARDLARKLDDNGLETATTEDLRTVLKESGGEYSMDGTGDPECTEDEVLRLRRTIFNLIGKEAADCGITRDHSLSKTVEEEILGSQENYGDLESVFDGIVKIGSRLEDQRSEHPSLTMRNRRQRQTDHPIQKTAEDPDDLEEQISRANGRRYNDQRAVLSLPGLNDKTVLEKVKNCEQKNDDELFALITLIWNAQANRMEDQRSELKNVPKTVTEEDDLDRLMRYQSRRMDDQRTELNLGSLNNNSTM